MSVHFRGCKVSMLKQVCRSGPEEMRCPITIFDLYSKKHYICCLNASIDAIR